MPPVEVVFFREDEKTVPVRDWLDSIPTKSQAKCLDKLGRLEQMGHELGRPEADYLRDDIYELRVRFQSVNYRMLYFFHGRVATVVSHGLTKEKQVPAKQIQTAIERKARFETDPKKYGL